MNPERQVEALLRATRDLIESEVPGMVPHRLPATVVAACLPGDVALLDLDEPDDEEDEEDQSRQRHRPIPARNVTGAILAPGDEVVVEFQPPSGAQVVGRFTPGAGPELVVFTSDNLFYPSDYVGGVALWVRVLGAGGAGGGTSTTVGGVSLGGGGAAGGYSEALIPWADLAASEFVTVGAGGIGGTLLSSTAGGDSSFGAHVTGEGGDPGTGSGSLAPPFFIAGGGPGPTGVGDVASQGEEGFAAFALSTTQYQSGRGGSASPYGRGGRSRRSSNDGSAAVGYGAGGGGGARGTGAGTAASGGNGAPGIVIVLVLR